jgi:hypothetical protein
MIELKDDRDFMGKDVYFNGQRVGWMSFGDLRQSPEDRRPVTMLDAEKGTRYHQSQSAAVAFIENIYLKG